MKIKYKIALFILGAMIIGSTYLGVSYSLWIQTFEGSETNVVETGCFTIGFEELTHSLSLKNTYPISDTNALAKVNPYQIKVTNTCDTTDAGYAITLNTVGVTGTKLDDSKVKVAVGINTAIPTSGTLLNLMEVNTETENIEVTGTLLTSYVINTGYIEKGTSKTFNIYLWIDESAGNEVANMQFQAGISVLSYATKISTLEAMIQNDTVANNGDSGVATNEVLSNNLEISEYRYVGVSPKNYIKFNNELWRIIGLVDTLEGQRVKIIRNTPLRNSVAMSNSGINTWDSSDIEAYYTNTYQTQIAATSSVLIDTVTWNLGTSADYSTDLNGSTLSWQSAQSSNTVLSGNATWSGKIGLMYPSDYGFATSGGATTLRQTCLNVALTTLANYSECINNNWLTSPNDEWLITPSGITAGNFFTKNAAGNLEEKINTTTISDRPTLYLKSGITLKGGSGSLGDPYIIN